MKIPRLHPSLWNRFPRHSPRNHTLQVPRWQRTRLPESTLWETDLERLLASPFLSHSRVTSSTSWVSLQPSNLTVKSEQPKEFYFNTQFIWTTWHMPCIVHTPVSAPQAVFSARNALALLLSSCPSSKRGFKYHHLCILPQASVSLPSKLHIEGRGKPFTAIPSSAPKITSTFEGFWIKSINQKSPDMPSDLY